MKEDLQEEVFEFANITGDKGRHHVEYDENED